MKVNGVRHYMWRAVDHEGEVLESYVTKRRDHKAALKFLRKSLRRYGSPQAIVTDNLRSYGAAMRDIGNAEKQQTGRWLNNRIKNYSPSVSTTRACHAEVSANAMFAEICRRSFFRPQSLQSGTTPLQPRQL